MHISIPDDLKKQFHAACALRGLKMSHIKFGRSLTIKNSPRHSYRKYLGESDIKLWWR